MRRKGRELLSKLGSDLTMVAKKEVFKTMAKRREKFLRKRGCPVVDEKLVQGFMIFFLDGLLLSSIAVKSFMMLEWSCERFFSHFGSERWVGGGNESAKAGFDSSFQRKIGGGFIGFHNGGGPDARSCR